MNGVIQTMLRAVFRAPVLLAMLVTSLQIGLPAQAVNIADIAQELEYLRISDQSLRNEEIAAREAARRAGKTWDAKQRDAYAERIAVIDFGNQVRFDAIVQTIGWPKLTQYGREAVKAAFTVVLHGDFEYQLNYLPLMRSTAAQGELPLEWLAVMEDKILDTQNLPQRYGSQVDTNNGVTLKPVEDPAGLDARRAQMGLEPVCTYLARFTARAGAITYPACKTP